jgi:cytochrome c oxidase subunit I
VPLHMPARIPAALNSFGLWLALMIGLTVVNYGYPIAQLMVLKETNVPAVYVGATR